MTVKSIPKHVVCVILSILLLFEVPWNRIPEGVFPAVAQIRRGKAEHTVYVCRFGFYELILMQPGLLCKVPLH